MIYFRFAVCFGVFQVRASLRLGLPVATLYLNRLSVSAVRVALFLSATVGAGGSIKTGGLAGGRGFKARYKNIYFVNESVLRNRFRC